jgi:putative SOS response-associated peptidase YedK
MPAILEREVWDEWLDPEFREIGALREMLSPLPPALMAEYPVSTLVNKVANNYPECIEPLK